MNRITFINHATVLIEMNGVRIITDPVYAFSISFFLPRLQRPGIPFEQLTPVDIVAVSHDHYDHLNLRTLRRISRMHQPAMVVPRGLRRFGVRTGFDTIQELQWWERVEIGNLAITCVPAKHFSGRGLFDRNRTLPAGFVFESKDVSVYFAGDTAYDSLFGELKSRFSVDVALLPIGAYKPHSWFRNIHLNPATALEAFLDCGARFLIPIHWGTFKLSDEPMAEPPEWLMREAALRGVAERVKVLRNGEWWDFQKEAVGKV